MPNTPFGRAVLDGIQQIIQTTGLTESQIYSLDALKVQNKNCNVHYNFAIRGRMDIAMPVRDFIAVPEADRNVLDEIQLPPYGRVADLGCGIGRHLAYIRHRYPNVECCGADFCDLQRAFAENNFPGPKQFVANINDLQGDFDAIFMLGNGLGVFGDEDGIINGLRNWGGRIKPGGYFVIETSSFSGRDFDALYVSTAYGAERNPFFPWYGASSSCLQRILRTAQEDGTCFDVSLRQASHPRPFYIAIAKKR